MKYCIGSLLFHSPTRIHTFIYHASSNSKERQGIMITKLTWNLSTLLRSNLIYVREQLLPSKSCAPQRSVGLTSTPQMHLTETMTFWNHRFLHAEARCIVWNHRFFHAEARCIELEDKTCLHFQQRELTLIYRDSGQLPITTTDFYYTKMIK